MNILPKKRWHVRTKENIARVRRDEALAAEQAKIEQARIDKAESEARLNFLRNEARKKSGAAGLNVINDKPEPIQSTSANSSKHINFFEELEQGNIDYSKPNKDYEKDKKEEQEKYEKQIGYLTYLGQGVKEAVSKSWYNELPKRLNDAEKNIEIKPHKKSLEDPIQDIKRYLNIISLQKQESKSSVKLESKIVKCKDLKYENKKLIHEESNERKRKRKSSSDSDSSEEDCRSHKKHKKHRKHKKSKNHRHSNEKEVVNKSHADIEKLRAERLERERREKLRTQALLAEVKGQSSTGENSQLIFRQKYNSQFFPELARQNCDKNYR